MNETATTMTERPLAHLPDTLTQDRIKQLDLASDALRADFIAQTAAWAQEPPFYAVHNGTMQVVCGRHRDCMEVYQDRTRFSTEVPQMPGFERFDKFMGVEALSQLDGERHDRLRKLLAPAFGPGSVKAQEARITSVIDGLLDPIVERGGTFDAQADFAQDLMPRILLDSMFEMNEEEKAAMRRMGEALPIATRIAPGDPFPPEYVAAFEGARKAVNEIVERRRAAPGDDLISALVLAEQEGDRLSSTELFNQVFSITAGALQSTATSMASVLYVLHTHPTELAKLRADHSLAAQAIEECLRYHGAGFLSFPRFATEDAVVGGTFIPKGSTVRVSPQAACLDGTVYPDPLRVDIDRKPKNMPLFGAGPHLCLGNRLARMVLRIALEGFLERLPTMELADPEFVPTYRGQVSETQIAYLPMRVA